MSDLLAGLTAALSDRYTIERELGSGGMATVYLAEDVKHHRKVAVKVLRPDLAAALGADRFHREIEIAAQLTHPNVLTLIDSGAADGFLYYVMPYIEGQSLRDRLAHERELPIAEAVRILRDVVDALDHAHKHGVVHRDIKPDNVLLSERHALVTDFGVAKAVSEATGRQQLTTEGIALGTPSYMSPEQAAADSHIDHRADIYAVGVVAYELLTGRPPFLGTTPQMILSAHMTDTPEPLRKYRASVPPAFEQVVMKCLEKKAADRWQSAEELLPQLEALATPSGGVTPTGTMPVDRVARRRWRTVAAVVAIVAVAAGLTFALERVVFSDKRETFEIVTTTSIATEKGGLDPALSPDGRLVAHAAGEDPETSIHVSQVEGTGTVNLTDGLPDLPHRWPRWSPDGDWIVYEGAGSVYVISALGGVPRRLTEGTFPSWSPDGQHRVFVRRDTLLTLVLDATAAEVVATAYLPHSPAWSPDGSRLAHVVGNPLWREFNEFPSAISIVDLRSGTEFSVTGTVHANQSPQWGEHGRGLFFVSNRDGTGDAYYRDLGELRCNAVTRRYRERCRCASRRGRALACLASAILVTSWLVMQPNL